jgi:hypothetical protein
MYNLLLKFIILLLLLPSFANAQESDFTQVALVPLPAIQAKPIEEGLSQALDYAENTIQDANKSLQEAESVVQKPSSPLLKEIATDKALIEQTRRDVAKSQIKLASILKEKNDNLYDIAVHLRKIDIALAQRHIAQDDLMTLYQETLLYWRELADSSLSFFSRNSYWSHELPNLLTLPQRELSQDSTRSEDGQIFVEYNQSRYALLDEYANLLSTKQQFIEASKNYQAKLLLQSGKIRASILLRLEQYNANQYKLNNAYFADLARELKLIPYRPFATFYSKISDYRQALNSGTSGMSLIIKQLGVLLFFVGILFIGIVILRKLIILLEGLKKHLVKSSLYNNSHAKWAIFLSKSIPYFPWVAVIIIFELAKQVLRDSIIAEIGVVMPYFQYYFLYRIFKIFTFSTLNDLLYLDIIGLNIRTALDQRIKKFTEYLGLYLLGAISLLHLTESIVRQALVYHLIFNLFVAGFILLLLFLSGKWSKELESAVKRRLSKTTSQITRRFLQGKMSLLFALPISVLLLLNILFRKITSWLTDNDFVKRILAQSYKRKLESAAKTNVQLEENYLSNSYLKRFLIAQESEDFIEVADHPYDGIKTVLHNWQEGKNQENSMVLFGENGMGASLLLDWIKRTFANNTEIINIAIPKKLTNKKQIETLLSNAFGFQSAKNLTERLSNHKKRTIILMDNCHDLFLAKHQGFEALNCLFDLLINVHNNNIFWVASFNHYAWRYLQNALRIDRYFRYQFKLEKWRDEDIQKLILKKHERTGFKLIYDPLIFAMDAKSSRREFNDLHEKFFQMLWSESKGNPQTAMQLWISSLSLVNKSTIKVALPKTAKASDLTDLSDNQFFIYAAITKHHNLSLEEIAEITSLPTAAVINIVRIGVEKQHLEERQPNRYYLSAMWQIVIVKLLKDRNFIYG